MNDVLAKVDEQERRELDKRKLPSRVALNPAAAAEREPRPPKLRP